MPHYKSRSKSRAARDKQRVRAQVPKDKRKISQWAVKGSHDDYEQLRQHATNLAHGTPPPPSYVTGQSVDLFKNATRVSLLEANHKKDNHWFTDGLAWLLDKAPSKGFGWLKGAGQAALKPFRGDSLSEVDEQFARLVEQGYKTTGERADEFEHWQRQGEFDSDYLSVWDNEDGHRFVSVRGTKGARDVGEDLLVGVSGRPSNLVGDELKRVLDHTEPGRHVDVGGHSLGTGLILTAYSNDPTLQDRVHQSYLYNPTYSPVAHNITSDYEKDERVRYFIDLMDPVSVGGLGSKGPSNAVYRSNYKMNPLDSHKLVQWGGTNLREHDEDDAPLVKKDELPYDRTGDGVPNLPEPAGQPAEPVVNADEFVLDFGDNYDGSSWNEYWDDRGGDG